jgi:hypothetical protein
MVLRLAISRLARAKRVLPAKLFQLAQRKHFRARARMVLRPAISRLARAKRVLPARHAFQISKALRHAISRLSLARAKKAFPGSRKNPIPGHY